MRAYIVPSNTRGIWKLRYWENGVRKEITRGIGTFRQYATKEAAEKANAHLLRQYSREETTVPTVHELVERYRTEGMPERNSTRRGYECWIKNHILPRWGDSTLTDLKADPVEMWLRDLPLSTKSKRNIKGVLTLLWLFGMKKEVVPQQPNPMELVTIRKRKGEKKHLPMKDLTADQLQALLQALDSNPELQAMVKVTFNLGLRISETRGLQWRDVNWLERTVTLERGVVKQDVDDVKTEESARTMPMSDEVMAVLRQWRSRAEFTQPDDWIFSSPWKHGKQPVSYSWIWYGLSVAGRTAGIGHLSSHAFRNTFRTHLDANGISLGVQQKMMRHADIRTTMNNYGTALKADMRRAAEGIARVSAGFNRKTDPHHSGN